MSYLSRLAGIRWNPFSQVLVRGYGECRISKNATLRNSTIYVAEGASLSIGNNVIIQDTRIFITEGAIVIGDNTICKGTTTNVDKGEVHIADHSMIRAKRLWVRFGGKLAIGSYTNINEGSEVRCDLSVSIGSYCQISYNVNIWDTNTHSILPRDVRRQVARDKFPAFGYESTRPVAKTVVIGDDCWIGMNSTIMKGSRIGNESIVAYGTLITGKEIPERTTVANELTLRLIKHS